MNYITTIFNHSPLEIEQAANFCMRPIGYFLNHTRKVEILSLEDKLACHIAEVQEKHSCGKTVVMVLLAIPSLLIGIPLKLLSVFCFYSKEERSLVSKAITHIKSPHGFYSENPEILEEVKNTYEVLKVLTGKDLLFFSDVKTLSLLFEGKEDQIPLDMTPHDANRMFLSHNDWCIHLESLDTQNYFSRDLDPSDELTSDYFLKKINFKKNHGEIIIKLLQRNPRTSMTCCDLNIISTTSHDLFKSYLHVLN